MLTEARSSQRSCLETGAGRCTSGSTARTAEVKDSFIIGRFRFGGEAGRCEAPHAGDIPGFGSGPDYVGCLQFRATEQCLDDSSAESPAAKGRIHDQRHACCRVCVPLDVDQADGCPVCVRQPGEPPGHPAAPVLGRRIGGQAEDECGPAGTPEPALGLLIFEPRRGDRQGAVAEGNELNRSHRSSIAVAAYRYGSEGSADPTIAICADRQATGVRAISGYFGGAVPVLSCWHQPPYPGAAIPVGYE